MTAKVFPATILERLNEGSTVAVEECAALARALSFSPFDLGLEMCRDEERVEAITKNLVRCFVSRFWQVDCS